MRIGHGLLLASVVGASLCPTPDRHAVHDSPPAAGADRVAGRGPRGYILFSPLLSTATYLIDTQGRVVHIWEGDFPPGASAYLLDNGLLLRPARDPELPFFSGGGQGGRIQAPHRKQ